MMEGWERVQYIMEKEGFNKNSFSVTIGINNNVTITRIINEKRNPSRSTCEKIVSRFPHYNIEWLLEGKGDITNSNHSTNYGHNLGSINGDNKSSYTNVGNTVSVTMPESGTQKIIKPTGEVEIHRLNPSDKSNSGELDRLQQRIQDLERIISEKDATIKSKDDLICVLKDMLNRQ